MRIRPYVSPVLRALVLVTLLLAPAPAAACATCGCGDPTLTTMGQGPTFAGRTRFGLRLRYRWDQLRAEDARVELHEARAEVSASYAFDERVSVSVMAPAVLRRAAWSSLRAYTVIGPADVELRGRFLLLRDRAFAPEHLLGVTAGLGLPTSIDQVDGQGRRLPVDVQTGSGAFTPMAGLYYMHLADPHAVFASASVAVPVGGRYDETGGPSLRFTVAAQQRLTSWLSIREGVDARWDAPATIGERTDPRSDHFTLFVSPDVLLSPAPDWVVSLGVRIPTLQLSEQGREEGWMFLTSVTVDT